MQRNKVTKKNSDLEMIISDSEKLTSSLADVMEDFQTKRNTKFFDFLKSKGIAISSLLSIMLILPFYGCANICQLMKCGIKKTDIEGKKTTFYDTKNNEFINWRKLLMFHAKRFRYLINNNINLKSIKTTALIFDDTTIEKTGKKIEKVSSVHDHVSGIYVLGFKLLVCGFWDGQSFIPLDFSLHREKGTKQETFINEYNRLKKQTDKLKKELEILENRILKYSAKSAKKYQSKQIKLEEQRVVLIKETEKSEAKKKDAYKKLKNYYSNHYMFGLSPKERKEQFKKPVSTQSHGFIRRKEADKSKITCMISMLLRVVKMGILADYVLIDSWFFCLQLLDKLSKIKKGTIKLVSMVKINNQNFTICATDKELPVKTILKLNERKSQRCKKFKADYIRIKCMYKGIRVDLFFVKMGKSGKWHLLLTTDLELNFVKLMEIYQIRWTIETFFKESKQYLHLSDCSSNTFDAQIADITITMMQHIMISYFKRVNYQQSFSGLFVAISSELVVLDLVTQLISILKSLVELLCDITGIDFIVFQQDIMRNESIQDKLKLLIPEKVFKNVA